MLGLWGKADEVDVSGKSRLEDALAYQMRLAGLPEPLRQYRLFAELVGKGRGLKRRLKAAGFRNFVFDFCWIEERLLLEVQGGTWIKGAHTRGKRYRDDCEKSNEAQLLGWCVLSVTSDMISDGSALALVERALKG